VSALSDIVERLRTLIFRGREEREMDEEMRFHMEMAGRRAFGGMEQHKEDVRDARGTRMAEELVADINWSIRTLIRRPRFTIIAIVTLALGVGGVTAVFSAVDAVLLRPLPYADASQLVRIYGTSVTNPDLRTFLSTPHFLALRSQLAAVSNATAIYTYDVDGADVDLGSGAERIRILPVSADYFTTLGTQPTLGRAFDSQEENSGAPDVILSYDFWAHRFGADAQVLGRPLVMDGVPHTIVGVGPAGLRDPIAGTIDAWTPVDVSMSQNGNAANAHVGNHWLTVVARLRPGVALRQAQAQIDVLGSALAVTYPDARDARFHIVPLKTDVVGPADRALELMFGAVALVLLLVCVNIANLLLVRGSERRRELAVRTALGAGSARIVRQLLVESATLAIAGGLAGLLVARVAMTALVRLGAGSIPRLEHLTLDPRMLGFTLLASSLSAIIFGLTPALRAARTHPSTAFREQAAGASSRTGQGGLRAALVVAQVALAFMLLVGAGLLITSLARLRQTPLGVPTDHVLTFRVTLPDARFDSVARARFYERLAQHLTQIRGVKAAGGISRLPTTGQYHQWGATALTGPLAGNVRANLATENRVASGDYFTAARIPVLEGRVFDARDDAVAPRRIVISRLAADQFFPGADPIGQRMMAGEHESTVIGVVGNVAMTVDGATEAYIYYPHLQFAGDRNWSLTQVVLTIGPPLAIEPSVRQAVKELDPQLVVEQPATLDDIVGQSSAQRVFTTRVLAAFAAVALALAAVGLFGILSYVVTLRGKEIGIRMALGAGRGTIRSMVLRQGLTLTVIGIAAGLFGAIALSKVIASLLFGTSALDPLVLAGAVLFMGLVAAIAAWFPARRATAVDPRTVLQGE
jgi:putative ABC transport system permease protein